LGLATFPGWRTEYDERTGSDIDIKPFPSSTASKVASLPLGSASLLLMISALWQHVAAASVVAIISNTAQRNNVVGHVGAGSVALVWLSFASTAIAFQSLMITVVTVFDFHRLTDE
jgi:hypothetical protein